jgi:acyl dehydratase
MSGESTFEFPIEAGHVLAFRRALGIPDGPFDTDLDPAPDRAIGVARIGTDSAAPAEGAAVPATFVVASAHFDPSCSLRPRDGEPWITSRRLGRKANTDAPQEPGPRSSRADPSGNQLGTTFLAEQNFDYLRHPVTGETLTVSSRPGERWEKEGLTGRLCFFEEVTEYRDAMGVPVVVTRSVIVETERTTIGASSSRSVADTGAEKRADFEQIVVEDLTRTQIVQYAGASGDFNPLHTDEVFATTVAGFPSVIAHGMLTMGLTGRMLTGCLGDQSLLRFGGRFLLPVSPGDSLLARGHVVEQREHGSERLGELDVSTRNQQGLEVFRGRATARLSN